MRTWLLTNSYFGTWLPGDRRGSVTSVRDKRPNDPDSVSRIEHDIPGTPWEKSLPGLYCAALKQMKGPPIYFDREKAEIVLTQFQETARFRYWELRAVAIMFNHLHWIVQVEGDPCPRKILADFKAYGSRALNRRYGKPRSGTWWTSKGSKRKLGSQQAIRNGIHYVLFEQPNPLLVWSDEHGRLV